MAVEIPILHDQLTEALNRCRLEEIMDKEVARAARHETSLCVALLDIDNFKKLNDSMGHNAGDQALVHLAAACRETLRPQDTVARYGGEEFTPLLPETELEEAATAITQLQRKLTKKFFLHDNDNVLITFSAGVTQMRPDDSQASIIDRADHAMHHAKQTGKNRVIKAPV
ncbi:GGDEF domain-containing protein [Propionivibrio sp.]|uniref:GGDEF domain-containing protein n=1 Tax=Propionivibrio sp. TaxID=2212460 RepID=UPI00272EC42A|nr:GGDEF domain-containing protein [Propionivibrio sp.]